MSKKSFSIEGNIVSVENNEIFHGRIEVSAGEIKSINRLGAVKEGLPYISPGFIDSHVHIESSMLIPSEFARLAVVHGTVATISDPHEIANVCGLEGVRYMIENGKKVNFKFNFGAPSCVPATIFETAGAALDFHAVEQLLADDEILYLSEMMNFPGVLSGDHDVLKKLDAAKKRNKPVDGHAPGLRGEQAKKYIQAGISTDHECFTEAEALEKLQLGMKILIREGSAAKNFEALIPLLRHYPDDIMFCSDDKHPDSLVEGHIDKLCARAVAKNIDVFKVLKAACVNPVKHYGIKVGLLKVGDPADLVVLKDLRDFEVLQTYIAGELVAENGQTKIASVNERIINNFHAEKVTPNDLQISASKAVGIPVIEAIDGQLMTKKLVDIPTLKGGFAIADPSKDILKIAVVNRYHKAPVSVGFIRNFGIRDGAIASTVAHDSHNIIAVGTDDDVIAKAINLLVDTKGGVCFANQTQKKVLPLPVAGLMSNSDGYEVAAEYTRLDTLVKEAGTQLSAPFMTLSFMALLVIPSIKLSDKGMFDGDRFTFY